MGMLMKTINRIILSRTDNIGDVILTLPIAGILKQLFPHATIGFLGKKYTRPVVSCSVYVDEFYDWDEISKSPNKKNIFSDMRADAIIHVFPNKEIAKLAKEVKIPLRIGTNRRLHHWFTCNRLVNLTRKNSILHESQLNIKLLEAVPRDLSRGAASEDDAHIPRYVRRTSRSSNEGSGPVEQLLEAFDFSDTIPFKNLANYCGFKNIAPLPEEFKALIDPQKKNIIFHPKSKGSAREWPADYFVELAKLLPQDKYKIFVSGTQEEKSFIEENILKKCAHINSIVGLFSLDEFISFIAHCDGLIAASTGPLHIAAVLNKLAIGVYPPLKAMTPQRWSPIGQYVKILIGGDGSTCQNPCQIQKACPCMQNIQPQKVLVTRFCFK
jgi:heptosyltransferase-3